MQIKSSPRVVNSAMVHGILTQLVTGVLLVGIAEADDADVDHAKIGVKLAVAVVVAVLVFANRKRDGARHRGLGGDRWADDRQHRGRRLLVTSPPDAWLVDA